MFLRFLHLFLNSREKTLCHDPLIPRSSLCSKGLTSKRLRTAFPSLMHQRVFSTLTQYYKSPTVTVYRPLRIPTAMQAIRRATDDDQSAALTKWQGSSPPSHKQTSDVPNLKGNIVISIIHVPLPLRTSTYYNTDRREDHLNVPETFITHC